MIEFPNDVKSRNDFILAEVEAGNFFFTWGEVTSKAKIPGSKEEDVAIFRVMQDALMVGGVRVNVSARLQTAIADVLGASLMTALVSDLRFAQASVKVGPKPMPITSSTQAMVLHSHSVDEACPPGSEGKLISTVGKDWIIDEKLTRAGKACNYGWHFFGYSYQGISGSAACSQQGKERLSVIQPNATAHDPDHVDYSQVCVLMDRACTVNGEDWDVLELMGSEKAHLISHTGKLSVFRQPL